jgi:hypothetical protein
VVTQEPPAVASLIADFHFISGQLFGEALQEVQEVATFITRR